MIVGFVGLLGVAAACTPPTTPTTPTNPALVSIAVSSLSPTIAPAASSQFRAQGTFADGTTRDITDAVGWTSSDPAVATVSNHSGTQGQVRGVMAGMATVTAARGLITGSATVTVQVAAPATLVSIAVTPTNPSVPAGRTRQLTATGTYSDGSSAVITDTVTWSSSSPALASVSNAAATKGVVTGIGPGLTTISATSGAVTGSTSVAVGPAVVDSIAVTPSSPTITQGTTQQFTATGTFSDGTTQDLTTVATWTSADPSIATVSNAAGSEGLVTGVGCCQVDISATLGAVVGSTTLTVNPVALESIDLTPTNPTIAVGATQQFTATGHFSDGTTADVTDLVEFSSSDPTIVAISNAPGTHGIATGVAPGTTTVTIQIGPLSTSTTVTVPVGGSI